MKTSEHKMPQDKSGQAGEKQIQMFSQTVGEAGQRGLYILEGLRGHWDVVHQGFIRLKKT